MSETSCHQGPGEAAATVADEAEVDQETRWLAGPRRSTEQPRWLGTGAAFEVQGALWGSARAIVTHDQRNVVPDWRGRPQELAKEPRLRLTV